MEHQIDMDFFWRGMYHYYTCSRNFPKTLQDFKAKYGDWNMDDAFG